MNYQFGYPDIGIEIPPGANLMVLGDIFSGKDILYKEFIREGLKNGEACIFVSTNDPIQETVEEFSDYNLEYLGMVNCISSRIDLAPDFAYIDQVRFVNSPTELATIMAFVNDFLDIFRAKDVPRIRIVFDSVSTLLMYSNLKTIFKFLHVLTNTVKSTKAVLLMIMEEGVHDKIEITSLERLSQGIITMSDGELEFNGFSRKKFTYENEDDQIIITGEK
jgi:KaiC/GvpD/RAD55 family RecA-like ATPase